MEKTKFTPQEAEEFREIFSYWAVRAAALDAGQEAPKAEKPGSPLAGATRESKSEDLARNLLLTHDGMVRVIRSLGITMSQTERRELDDKLDQGPFDEENPGKYGFLEFLIFMRWML